MISIRASDLPPFSLPALASIVQPGVSLQQVVEVMLAAGVLDGFMGDAARGAVGEVLARLHPDAVRQLVEILPPDLAAQVIDEEGVDCITRAGGRWISGNGQFAVIVPGKEALIGTGDEVVAFLTKAAMRAARSVASDASVPADIRYEAATMARPQLRVV